MNTHRRSTAWRTWFGAAALLGSAFVATGCAALQQNHASNPAVQVITKDSLNGHVSLVQTRVIEDHVTVNGYVEKRFHRGGMIPGKLVIAAIGRDGQVLQEVESDYHRRFAKSSRAYFAETLAVNPDEVKLVRVTHLGFGR